jgi:hypothetical protein
MYAYYITYGNKGIASILPVLATEIGSSQLLADAQAALQNISAAPS